MIKKLNSLIDNKYQSILISLIAIMCGLIIGSIIFVILGKNPLEAYKALLQGSGLLPKVNYAGGKGMFSDFLSFLDILAPMMFAALAVGVALKSGIFNIGVAGQMLVSGFVASIIVGYSDLPAVIAKPLVIIIGMLVGALIGMFVGFLKHRFNVNEVVSTIMINYIAQFLVGFAINSKYLDPLSRQSKQISQASRLTLKNINMFGLKVDFPIAIFLVIIVALILKFIFDKTTLGYELKAVGHSSKASRYAGISIKGSIIKTMAISGALAGLAGVSYYLGFFASISPKTLPETGFNAIAVSLLGNSDPIGIIFSSFFITIITKGSTYMSSTLGVESEIASVITAIILIFSACSAYIRFVLNKRKKVAK